MAQCPESLLGGLRGPPALFGFWFDSVLLALLGFPSCPKRPEYGRKGEPQEIQVSEILKEHRTTSSCITGSNSGMAIVGLLTNRGSPVLCVCVWERGVHRLGLGPPCLTSPLLWRSLEHWAPMREQVLVASSGRLLHVSRQDHSGIRASRNLLRGRQRRARVPRPAELSGPSPGGPRLGSRPYTARWQAAPLTKPLKWGGVRTTASWPRGGCGLSLYSTQCSGTPWGALAMAGGTAVFPQGPGLLWASPSLSDGRLCVRFAQNCSGPRFVTSTVPFTRRNAS